MKIKLDSIIFSIQKQGGISIYWKELILRLRNSSDIHSEVVLYQKNNNPNQYEVENLQSTQFLKIKYLRALIPISILRFLPFFNIKSDFDIFHSSYLNYIISFKKKININILTIHDMGYERNLTQKGFKRWLNLFFKYFALKNVDAIICISEFTQKELNHFYPFCKKKIQKVIYNGVSGDYKQISCDNINRLHNREYILFIGTRYDYKNFKLAVDIVEKLSEYDMVIVGGGKLNKTEIDYLDKNISNRYFHFNSVDNSTLNNLYNFAHCLLYPSIYEGFGIPIIEAMRAGCPFVAYNIESISEITMNSGILLNKTASVDDFKTEILKLKDDIYRQNIVNYFLEYSLNFSWDKCYTETIKFYEELNDFLIK